MMTKQRLSCLTIATIFLVCALPALATPPAPAPPKVEPAGKITALLPVARIARGAGRNVTRVDAKKDDQVIWNDKITTEKGGRARITLNDQSILSLGSQAELTIVKHDARVQQTQLQLSYGRVRAEVAKITRQGGGFELRTPTAVAGVIGTDFGTDSSTVGSTTFICISGLVQVSNSDPNIAGSVQCAPGLTTTVTVGKAPTPPTNATPEQIQQLIQDTEPAIISAMAPMTALPGATIDATINGTKLAGVNGVNISGDGVQVSLSGTPSDTAVTVHMVVTANAAPGPRTIHLTKSSGADSAAVFTILAPPNAVAGNFSKPYLDLIGQIGTTSAGGLSAYLAQLQQTAAQAIQDLQQKNATSANLNNASTAFNTQVSSVQNSINDSVNQINTAVTQAGNAFQTQYDAAYKALLQRRPDGTADDEFNIAIKTSYDSISAALGNTIKAITGNLTQLVAQANTNIAQTQQSFLQQLNITPPVPALNYTERSIDLGAALGQGGIPALDAGNSKGTNGATIISYKWMLCDPSYKPAQIGVPLVGTTTGCNAVQGYTSSSSDFQFPTCNLPPNDYVARVLVTDSNNEQAAMDAKLHILAPTYDDPATVVRDLAQGYSTRQPDSFLMYFDQTAFAGYTALSENVRNTFPTLASMQINPRISQAAITCNDATVRADWVQNYIYKANLNITFSQSEQLSMRMVRTPGKGWFITDFQGDNGTVQGQLPGPVITDNPQPDLVTTAVFPSYVGQASTNPPVPPGTQAFTAVIQNVGGADFTGSTVVRFQLLDATSTPIGTAVDVPLPAPVAAGQTVNVSATMTVPNTIALGSLFHVLANVNPTCLPEAHCDAGNQSDEQLLLGTPVKLTQANTLTLTTGDTVGGQVQVQVSDAASVTINLPVGIQLKNTTGNTATKTTTGAQTLSWDVVATLSALAGTNLQNLTVTANAGIPVSLTYSYNVIGVADYVITSVGFAGHSAPFTGANALQRGENTSVIAVVQNIGNLSASGSITATASCTPNNPGDTTSCKGGGNPTATFTAPAAGQSVTVNMPINNGGGGNGTGGDIPGSFTGTVVLSTTIPQFDTKNDFSTIQFDQVDFVVTVQNPLTPQNIVPSSSQSVGVTVQVVGTTPFAIPVTATTSPAYSGISFNPASFNVNGTQVFSVNAAAGTPAGGFGAVFTATNRGMSRPAAEGFAVINPQIVFTNLFLNDANNPLAIQVGAQATSIPMQLSGAAFSGLASISIPPVTGFTVNPDVTSIAANGTFNVSFTAVAATSVAVPVTVNVTLPNTNPPISISKMVFVKGVGASDLQLVSATTTLTGPWIDGQGADFQVTVQNNGAVATAGNELVHIDLNGITLGSTTINSLAAGASTQVTIHAVMPDIHGNGTFTGTGSLKIKVDPDPSGDTDYTNNSITQSVSLANWHVALNQSSPVQMTSTVGGASTLVSFTGTVDGSTFANYASLGFVPSQGQAGSSFTLSSFGQATDPECANSPAGTLFCAVAATTNAGLQQGTYFVQLIVTLTDANTGKSVQRQATVPIQLNTGNNGTNVTIASTANNCSGTNCSTTGSTLQINGGLAEQFSITLNMTCTTVGVAGLITSPCSGIADLAIHDASNTETTPLGSVQAVPTGTPLVLRVAPALDPNGNVSAGSASGYVIGISGANVPAAVRRNQSPISPDPVGMQVPFTINVGDLGINANTGANSCTGVVANGSPLNLTVNWVASGGFNVGTLNWEWETSTHSIAGGSPLSFSQTSGTTSGGGTYSPVSFTISNTAPQDGLQTYFLAVTISNGTSTATKYFPFYFDLSLGQNFCGAVSSARGFNRIQGSWSRSAAGFGGPAVSAAQLRSAVSTGSPDIHISAGDVSFTPSIPKVGDQVLVRFKATNTGDADAAAMPIGLQVNGTTVVTDTFDIAKGHSVLGGLTWTATADILRTLAGAAAAQTVRFKGKVIDPDTTPQGTDGFVGNRPIPLAAAVVVDPLHTRTEKSTADKVATLAHFSIRGSGPAATSAGATANSQRMLVELEDGACLGLRLSSGGMMPCGSADLEVTIADLAKSLLSLDTLSGVGDMGATFAAGTSSVKFTAQAAGMAGHTYAVQLPNGRTATVNVESVRNPAELDAKARALFRATAARIMRNMGDSSTAPDTGDLTGGGSHPTVFIILNVQGM